MTRKNALAREGQAIPRRTGWILMVLLALTVAVPISAVAIRGRDLAIKMPTVAQGIGAREATGAVQDWAPEWLADAVVVRATTSHVPGRDQDEGWTFQVYSPSRSVLAAVRVEEGAVSILRETPALYAQPELPLDDWRVDSQDALQTWWDNGGREAWERQDADSLNLRLGLNAANLLTWQFTVSWLQDTELGFWEIDAGSGALLKKGGGD